jgi:hypothetical protein
MVGLVEWYGEWKQDILVFFDESLMSKNVEMKRCDLLTFCLCVLLSVVSCCQSKKRARKKSRPGGVIHLPFHHQHAKGAT